MNAPFFPPDPAHVTEARTAAVLARAPRVAEIKTLWRRRQMWVRSDVKLVLQAQAFCRVISDGDKKKGKAIYKATIESPENNPAAWATIMPLESARLPIQSAIKEIEKVLVKLARDMPGASLCAETKGVGIKGTGLASIIGEACGDCEEDGTPRDIASYSTPGQLWKRMGLAPYNGKAYATWRGAGGLHAAEWEDAGYSPSRRSAMFNVGSGLIGGMGRGKRPLDGEDISALDWTLYEKLFVERCRYEITRDPSMARPVTEDGKESYSKHAQARAKRYVEKRFLRELWKEWRSAGLPS